MALTLRLTVDEPGEEKKLKEVPLGPELLRIMQLPRREIPDLEGAEAQQLADWLTEKFRLVPLEELKPGPLLPVQAVSIREAFTTKGLFGQIGVGRGKMFTAWMIAGLFNLERMMYVCMGNGTADAELKFAEYRKCWKGPRERQLPVFSYELLSNPSSAEELDEQGNVVRLSRLARLRPQLIILDEAQCCTNGAGYMYMKQYLRDNPDTIVIVLTGTPYRTSIKDAATLMEWSLKGNSPLPRGEFFQEREAWAGFLDAKEAIFGRTELGALARLGEMYGHKGLRIWDKDDVEEAEALRTTVRRIVAQRILETPGVIGTQDPPLNVRLTIEPWYPLLEDASLTEKYATMRSTQQTPDAFDFGSPMDGARHEATLGYTFWQKFDPMPPKEWKDARNAWNKACRKKLQKNNRRIHSEAKLKAAVRKGLFPDLTNLLKTWETAEAAERERTGLREPPTVCVFESEEVVDSVRDWVRQYNGLIWVGHIGLGEMLSERLEIPYYGAGGGWDEKRKLNIRDHKGGPAIASVDACGTGKNLQGFWSANLWLTPPGEQSMARTHRLGQKAAVVTNHVYLGCARHLDSFERAKEVKARFQADMTLAPLKLIYADNTMPDVQQLVDEMGNTVRWASKALDADDDF